MSANCENVEKVLKPQNVKKPKNMVRHAVMKITKIHFLPFLHFCKGGTWQDNLNPITQRNAS